jgi:protein-disulfide isomerase
MARGKAKKRKRAAQRAQTPAVKQAPRAPRAAGRRRWVVMALAAAVAIAIAVGVILASTRDSDGTGDDATLPNAAEAVAIFSGIPQQGPALGRANAPATIVEFVDLQCPFCRELVIEAVPTLIQRHIRPGRARLEVRGLAFLGPDSERGMRASFAAGRQNRMFELMELLYYNQGAENSGWLSEDLVEAAARSVPGLDEARVLEEMNSDAVSRLLEEHAEEAERRNVSGTPTIFVGPTGGELSRVALTSATDVAAVERAIAAAARR